MDRASSELGEFDGFFGLTPFPFALFKGVLIVPKDGPRFREATVWDEPDLSIYKSFFLEYKKKKRTSSRINLLKSSGENNVEEATGCDRGRTGEANPEEAGVSKDFPGQRREKARLTNFFISFRCR